MSTQQGLPHSATQRERAKVIAAGLCALVLTVGLARFAYTPMLPIMRDQAGLSIVSGGWLATWNYAGYMAGALIAANLSRLESKYVLYRVGLVLGVVTTIATGLTQSLLLWDLLRFLAGVAAISGSLLASGLVLDWHVRNGHQPELGLHFMGMGAGIIVSGIAVQYLSAHWKWNIDWIGLGVLGTFFFCVAWAWMPAPVSHGGSAARATHSVPSRSWTTLLSLSYLCAGYGYVVSATFIVDIVDRLPAFAGKGNWVWVIVGLAAVPASYIWDGIARRWGIVQALIAAFLLQTLSIVLPVLTRDAGWIALSAVLFGATFIGIVSLTLALVGRYYPSNPAKAMARMTLNYCIAQIAAPVITGYLSAHFGNYNAALIFVAVVMLVGIALLSRLAKTPVFSPSRAIAPAK
ncbi:YbfB/YjiJ family MFS transporter [Trinickia dinghuensis]|uniref:YbfB/YjiJ family MFS transporter n=1 Tax=Trinickia dinghuensis TaxID=2291023 RepID=A0A3D8JT99_9BURK|nr:YbfB/YjiJ family MFS transporter [Trinickia dinghuensis]RDU95774.1 YbfB/YjiJ family MFS transporter [Trinickia dinghuensis]